MRWRLRRAQTGSPSAAGGAGCGPTRVAALLVVVAIGVVGAATLAGLQRGGAAGAAPLAHGGGAPPPITAYSAPQRRAARAPAPAPPPPPPPPAGAPYRHRPSDVVFFVITGRPNQEARVPNILGTWGRSGSPIVFISETPSDKLPLQVFPEIPDSYKEGVTPKLWAGLKHAWGLYRGGAKWFVKVDDDTYVNVPGLLRFLDRHYGYPGAWREPHIAGRCGAIKGKRFVDGGAGIVMSWGLVHGLLKFTGGLDYNYIMRAQPAEFYSAEVSLAERTHVAFGLAGGPAALPAPNTSDGTQGFHSDGVFACDNGSFHHGCAAKMGQPHMACIQPESDCISLHYCDRRLMRRWHATFSASNSQRARSDDAGSAGMAASRS